MKKVRVRYAPSPTGHLHIGGARTALFNYLFAKHHNGDFIFRLEDTDLERNIPGGEQSQLDNLEWLGIIPDESPLKPGKYGPYRQTERLDLYRQYAQKLIDLGLAYECYCTSEELDESRKKQESEGKFSFRYEQTCLNLSEEQKAKYKAEGRTPSIRFRVPDKEYTWNDIVRGDITVPGKDISDWVIIKSNGVATYNFCVCIDDALMEITHVFRGEEHISNTPKQMMIYEALGFDMPQFGHLTLIVNEERKKLSKRDETIMQFISQYREEGYLPEAMFNFFALLGWSPETEEEVFSKEQLIAIFDENRFSKSPSMFDRKKLFWMNNHYIKNLSIDEAITLCMPYLNNTYGDAIKNKSDKWLEKLVALFQPQLNYGLEISELVRPFFTPYQLSDSLVDILKELEAKPLLEHAYNVLSDLDHFGQEELKGAIKRIGKESDRKGKKLFMPLRIAVSGQEHGADLTSVIELYGKDEILNNIKTAMGLL